MEENISTWRGKRRITALCLGIHVPSVSQVRGTNSLAVGSLRLPLRAICGTISRFTRSFLCALRLAT